MIQKSLDNLNCDLQEGDQKPEQVYLLRLHHANFDCRSPLQSSTMQRPDIQEKILPKINSTSKGDSVGVRRQWNYLVALVALLVKLLVCNGSV